MICSHHRGHNIHILKGEWVYSDNKKLVSLDPERTCGFCGLTQTKDGHDGCLGALPGVLNACCGHGVPDEAYVQFMDKPSICGNKAIYEIIKLKSELPELISDCNGCLPDLPDSAYCENSVELPTNKDQEK